MESGTRFSWKPSLLGLYIRNGLPTHWPEAWEHPIEEGASQVQPPASPHKAPALGTDVRRISKAREEAGPYEYQGEVDLPNS